MGNGSSSRELLSTVRSPLAGGATIPRRDVLHLLGCGTAFLAGASGLGRSRLSNGVSARQEGTPSPAAPAEADLAAALEYDVEKIFRFVSEEVGYEPYAGALRGARGTLWGLTGNSVDKAQLLGALLEESLIEYRFVHGELSEDAAARLEKATHDDAAAASERLGRAYGRSVGVDSNNAATQPASSPDPEIESAVDSARKLVEATVERVDARVRGLSEVLADAGVELPEPSGAGLPEREVHQHVWVQYAQGTSWIDLDPSVPGAQPGEAYASMAESMNELPDEILHKVRISLVVEELKGGELQRRDATTFEAPSGALVGVPVSIWATDRNAFQAIGMSINQAFSGAVSVVPVIQAGSDGSYGDAPIVLGSHGAGSDVFGSPDGTGPVDGEAFALFLTIELQSPDAPPVVVERVIFDRIGAEARAKNSIDLGTVPPVELVTGIDGDLVYPPLAGVTLLDVSVTRLPNTIPLLDAASQEIFGGGRLLGPSVAALRDGLVLKRGSEIGWQAFPNGVNVTAIHITEDRQTDDQVGLSISADLLHRSSGWLPLSGSGDSVVSPGVLLGVVEQVAEEFALSPLSDATEDVAIRPGPTVGGIFDAAAEQRITIQVIWPDDATALRDLAVSPAARSLMEAALRRAEIVVTPVSSVAINGTDVVGWWEINPDTGVVIDRLEDGRSGADFFLLSPMGGWARLVANLVKYSKHISCVGNAVGFSCALAAMIVAYGTPAFAALIIPTAAAGARAVGSCAGVG